MLNPYATFDCLAIGVRLQDRYGNVSVGEFHLFAYLSCLLSLYRKCPASEWQYKFISSPTGSPFSQAIAEVIDEMERLGLLAHDNEIGFLITDAGMKMLQSLITLSTLHTREEFIDGACSSTMSLPPGLIKTAVSQETFLHNAIHLNSTRYLLPDGRVSEMYDEFAAISEAIGVDVHDLAVPAVIWLSYMLECSGGKKYAS
ncbi:hypothetical protein LLG46_05770 [bacterium]|nr:hypothetical protein [bacterium]